MKIKILRFIGYLFKFITGSNFVDIAEHNAIKERLQKLEQQLARNDKPIYVDKHSSDEILAWRRVAAWADNDASRKWAFERVNALLFRMAQVTPANAQDFYVIQGALAEMNNFVNLKERVEAKLEEVAGEGDEDKTDSLSNSHS